MARGQSYIEAGKNRIKDNHYYDLQCSEIERFFTLIEEQNYWDAIVGAYFMGLEAGVRMEQSNKKRKVY